MNPVVILIGGNSGAGKTETATQIARRHGASLLLADDLRLALQRVTSPREHPEFHFFVTVTDYLTRLSAADIREGLIGVGKVVSHALEIVIAHHLHTELPVVIEGDGILPSLAAQSSFAGRPAEDKVKSVFLVESDPNEVLAAALKRDRGMSSQAPEHQKLHAESSSLFGEWLADNARECQLPVVESRPWATLVERVQTEILR